MPLSVLSLSLQRVAEQGLHRWQAWAHAHLRGVTRAAAVVLATTGVAAFGIAPLAPDAAALPTQWIAEPLALPDLGAQREALAVHQQAPDTPWFHSTETRPSDTAASVLKRLGVLDAGALNEMRQTGPWRRLLDGRPGKHVRARTNAQGELLELVARLPAQDASQMGSHFTRLTLQRTSGGLVTQSETVALSRGIRVGSGTIRSSLFEATDAAQIPDAVAVQIAEIFASEIDFHRELRKGDTFRVIYEGLNADGEPIAWNDGSGRVLAVEFVNQGQKLEAVWFQSSPDRGEYYDFQGQSRRRAFLASPLEFSRVSSGFKMRFHPILRSWRQHLGIDYAATQGTPVRTVGEGVVDFAGVQKGYGNVVVVKHSQDRSTLYAHLSRIDVRAGQRIDQGRVIGAVGSTGWSTGPHLHFEFKVGGVHKDPLVIAKSSETIPLPASAKVAFQGQVAAYAHRLEVAQSVAAARGRNE
jgi:murein DD-endopeptidase MepM/ murein hydrolase activator NlpD